MTRHATKTKNELNYLTNKRTVCDRISCIPSAETIKRKLQGNNYTSEIISAAIHLISQNYINIRDVIGDWSEESSVLPNSNQVDLAVKFVQANYIDEQIIRNQSNLIKQKLQGGRYKSEEVIFAIHLIDVIK